MILRFGANWLTFDSWKKLLLASCNDIIKASWSNLQLPANEMSSAACLFDETEACRRFELAWIRIWALMIAQLCRQQRTIGIASPIMGAIVYCADELKIRILELQCTLPIWIIWCNSLSGSLLERPTSLSDGRASQLSLAASSTADQFAGRIKLYSAAQLDSASPVCLVANATAIDMDSREGTLKTMVGVHSTWSASASVQVSSRVDTTCW